MNTSYEIQKKETIMTFKPEINIAINDSEAEFISNQNNLRNRFIQNTTEVLKIKKTSLDQHTPKMSNSTRHI